MAPDRASIMLGSDGSREVERPPDDGVHDPVIDLVGGVDDIARNVGARIVDQHIEASEPLENFLDGLVHGRGVAHVHRIGGAVRPGLPKCFGLRLRLLAVEIDDRDPITVGGESLGGGKTDPLRRSGNYDNALSSLIVRRPRRPARAREDAPGSSST